MAVNDAAAPQETPNTRGDGQPHPETTPTKQTLEALRRLRLGTPGTEAVIDQAIATIEELREEIAGLRYALTSRSTIDEAKGILMADRGCDEDTAFQILVDLSQETNVPVRDVAGAVVYRRRTPIRGRSEFPFVLNGAVVAIRPVRRR
jgi:hypothetical protein